MLLLVVLLPVALYMLLSVSDVQERIRTVAERELSHTLGAKLSIGHISIRPFKTLSISDVSLLLESDTIAHVSTVSAGFELFHLLRTGELVIDYALLDDASVRIWRADPQSPLNIEPIIAHLKSDEAREPSSFELKINTVIVRHGNVSYDILSAATPQEGQFDAAHISIRDFSLNAFIPTLSNNLYSANIDHMSFTERSGFTLSDMRFNGSFGLDGASLDGLVIKLPGSDIALENISIGFNGYDDIMPSLRRSLTAIDSRPGCVVTLSDLQAFAPVLSSFNRTLGIDIHAKLSSDSANVASLSIAPTDREDFSISISSLSVGSISKPDSMSYRLGNARIQVCGKELAPLVARFSGQLAKALARTGNSSLHINADGNTAKGRVHAEAHIGEGLLAADGTYSRKPKEYTFTVTSELSDIDAGSIAGVDALGKASGLVKGSYTAGHHPDASLEAKISKLTLKGYEYSNIAVNAELEDGRKLEADIAVDDPNAKLLAYAYYNRTDNGNSLKTTALVNGVDFKALGLYDKKDGYLFSAKTNIDITGNDIDDIAGSAKVFDIRWQNLRGEGMAINNISIAADPMSATPSLTLNSDVAHGVIRGPYTLSAIAPQLKELASKYIPALFTEDVTEAPINKTSNDFDFELTLLPSQDISTFLGLPVHVITDINIRGEIDNPRGRANINIEAPYLVQGNRLLENTSLYANLDSAQAVAHIYATTGFPTKKGDMTLTTRLGVSQNRIDTHIDWQIEREKALNGAFDFSTLLRSKPGKAADATFPIDARIEFNPGSYTH
ncbi:MAG: hypothetical protein K2F78_03845, partial [Muribaculaceae bacterium]|nr:hypothetical protein [Muribaculaceae bacterium]